MDIIWIWICSQRPAANLLLSESANIGAHSDFSNDPKAKWSCKTAKTANMDLLVQHVMTHLAKCCQESFNYLNSKINCCGCRAKSSTVLLLAFQILWKISLWTGILPQADRAQHGFTELTVYWDIVSNKIWTGMIRHDKTSGYLWTKFRLVAKQCGSMCQLWSHVTTQLFQWFGIQYHRQACQFLWHDIISPNIPQPFWMQPGAKTFPS